MAFLRMAVTFDWMLGFGVFETYHLAGLVPPFWHPGQGHLGARETRYGGSGSGFPIWSDLRETILGGRLF